MKISKLMFFLICSPFTILSQDSDSIFYAKPNKLLYLNLGRSVEIKAGEPLAKIGFTLKRDSIILRGKQGQEIYVRHTSDYPNHITELSYFFFPESTVNKAKKKYGNTVWQSILKCEVRIGWGKEQCRLSWGEPTDINTTVTSKTTNEQWVYSKSYLYFENGKLVTIQN